MKQKTIRTNRCSDYRHFPTIQDTQISGHKSGVQSPNSESHSITISPTHKKL